MNDTPSTVSLTSDLIHSASSHPSGDGFTKDQLAVLGISWPPSKGWLTSLIGKTITLEKFTLFKMAGDKKRAKNVAKKSEPNKNTMKPKTIKTNDTWQPVETAPKDRVILADVGYPWPLSCLWDAECGKWAVAFLNCDTKDEATKESRNVYWETEWEGKIMRWMEVPKL